jgi:DNA helicase-2/ATP-dependent DNA helicase PcrA
MLKQLVSDGFPTEEQRLALDDAARITVVRACPGSGKTRVFVEAINRHMTRWKYSFSGMAALSFTNAAQNEIADRIGRRVGSPHFIGTIDAFVYRYIVRPFAHVVGLSGEGPRLIASPFNEYAPAPSLQIGQTKGQNSVLSIYISQGDEKEPTFKARLIRNSALTAIAQEHCQAILAAKRQDWKKRGWINHSDCHYIASCILNDPKHGPGIVRLITQRFPLILVDEFQDTVWFLARTLLTLLKSKDVKALVVGDPDQAIYEFGGASPSLFSDLEKIDGASSRSLTVTQRCPASISTLITGLSESKVSIKSAERLTGGSATLVVHQFNGVPPWETLLKSLEGKTKTEGALAILARKTAVVYSLVAAKENEGYSGSSSVLRRLSVSATHGISGDTRSATDIISDELGKLVFKGSTTSERALKKAGIRSRVWREAIFTIFKANIVMPENESWNQWVMRMRTAFSEAINTLNISDAEIIKNLGRKLQQDKKEGNSKREIVPVPSQKNKVSENVLISTVHRVKGTEFDSVIFFTPKPGGGIKCPSKDWWSSANAEECRIAFVACSRARKNLAVAIHRDTHIALQKLQPAFLKLFDSVVELSTN